MWMTFSGAVAILCLLEISFIGANTFRLANLELQPESDSGPKTVDYLDQENIPSTWVNAALLTKATEDGAAVYMPTKRALEMIRLGKRAFEMMRLGRKRALDMIRIGRPAKKIKPTIRMGLPDA